jgi:hypothetical protein
METGMNSPGPKINLVKLARSWCFSTSATWIELNEVHGDDFVGCVQVTLIDDLFDESGDDRFVRQSTADQ